MSAANYAIELHTEYVPLSSQSTPDHKGTYSVMSQYAIQLRNSLRSHISSQINNLIVYFPTWTLCSQCRNQFAYMCVFMCALAPTQRLLPGVYSSFRLEFRKTCLAVQKSFIVNQRSGFHVQSMAVLGNSGR